MSPGLSNRRVTGPMSGSSCRGSLSRRTARPCEIGEQNKVVPLTPPTPHPRDPKTAVQLATLFPSAWLSSQVCPYCHCSGYSSPGTRCSYCRDGARQWIVHFSSPFPATNPPTTIYNVGQLPQSSRGRMVNWGSVLIGALLGLFCYSGL